MERSRFTAIYNLVLIKSWTVKTHKWHFWKQFIGEFWSLHLQGSFSVKNSYAVSAADIIKTLMLRLVVKTTWGAFKFNNNFALEKVETLLLVLFYSSRFNYFRQKIVMNSIGQFVLTALKSIKSPNKKCCNCHLNNCRPPEKAVSL